MFCDIDALPEVRQIVRYKLNKPRLPAHLTAVFFCVHFQQIARLREEGSRQLEEEQRLIREQIQREREAGGSVRHICPIPEFSFVQFVS